MTTTATAPPRRIELHQALYGRHLETLDRRFQARPADDGWIGWEVQGRLAAYRPSLDELRTWLTEQYAKTWGPGLFPGCHVRYDGPVADFRSRGCRMIRPCGCPACLTLREHQRRSGRSPYRFELQRLDDPHQILTHVSRRSLIALTPQD